MLLHRAVQIDRLVVARLANERDHALRLAERIGADEMRALGKQRDRMQELGDLAVGIAVAEHRQAERRLGDEHVAGHELERRAGRIGDVLVVAGGDDAQAVRFDRDLRRAEHVAGRMKRHRDAAKPDAFAVADRLRRARRSSRRSAAASGRASPAWPAPRRGPARAWSEWPCVMTARSTGRVGSMWKPPSLQHRPAGVGDRRSSGRMRP